MDESERHVVSDEVALQILFGALLGVEAGNVRQRSVRTERAAGYFQVVVGFGGPVVLRRRGGRRGLPRLPACG